MSVIVSIHGSTVHSFTQRQTKKKLTRDLSHSHVNARAGTVMCVPGVKIKQHSDALIVLLEC